MPPGQTDRAVARHRHKSLRILVVLWREEGHGLPCPCGCCRWIPDAWNYPPSFFVSVADKGLIVLVSGLGPAVTRAEECRAKARRALRLPRLPRLDATFGALEGFVLD